MGGTYLVLRVGDVSSGRSSQTAVVLPGGRDLLGIEL